MLIKYISLPVFIISFAIGLLFVYILGPEMKTVYIYPNPNNYKDILYQDNADQCFQYKPVVVSCPTNTLSIKTIPIQE